MKKLLLGALLLTSFSSFAENVEIGSFKINNWSGVTEETRCDNKITTTLWDMTDGTTVKWGSVLGFDGGRVYQQFTVTHDTLNEDGERSLDSTIVTVNGQNIKMLGLTEGNTIIYEAETLEGFLYIMSQFVTSQYVTLKFKSGVTVSFSAVGYTLAVDTLNTCRAL